jgi:hypothetical protein
VPICAFTSDDFGTSWLQNRNQDEARISTELGARSKLHTVEQPSYIFPVWADCNMSSSPQRALASLDNAISEAVRQSRLAYEFSPNSYTYGSLSACLSAENALDVIRAYLSEDTA